MSKGSLMFFFEGVRKGAKKKFTRDFLSRGRFFFIN